jgi:hypothetical protein
MEYTTADGQRVVARRIGTVVVEVPIYSARANADPRGRITQRSQYAEAAMIAHIRRGLDLLADMALDPPIVPGRDGDYESASLAEMAAWLLPAGTVVVAEPSCRRAPRPYRHVAGGILSELVAAGADV